MEIYLTEEHCRADLFPFTEIRHTAELRVGILTIKEKWEMLTGGTIHLSMHPQYGLANINIPANLLPTVDNYHEIIRTAAAGDNILESAEIKIFKYPWHISQLNDWAIRKDFKLLTQNKTSEEISEGNRLINPDNIFIEKGAIIDFSMLNAAEGPIYIGRDVQVMEGSMIRGPFAIGDNSVLKMGSKIYSGTTIGPWCVAGGEIKNSVFFGYSNKAHDGYLGDSVIGEWCNLGAGTSNSNLKNTAGDVLFNINGKPVNAGNKAGLMMGDYSRAAINTSFNTGTMVGICCNIFGSRNPPRNLPSFTWGEEVYELEKAYRDIDNWKKLKNKSLSDSDKIKLTELYTNKI